MQATSRSSTGQSRWVRWFGCVLMAGLLTGCTFSRIVQVTLAPKVDQPLKEPGKASLEVAPVQDSRRGMYEWILLYDRDTDGSLECAYITEKPVPEIFGDGLNAALQQNGFFETTNATRYVLQSEIQIFDYDNGSMMGGDLSTPKLCLYINFELINRGTGQSVWHQAYIGKEPSGGGGAFWTKKLLGPAFSAASEDVIRQLISDRTFRSYFELQGTNAP